MFITLVGRWATAFATTRRCFKLVGAKRFPISTPPRPPPCGGKRRHQVKELWPTGEESNVGEIQANLLSFSRVFKAAAPRFLCKFGGIKPAEPSMVKVMELFAEIEATPAQFGIGDIVLATTHAQLLALKQEMMRGVGFQLERLFDEEKTYQSLAGALKVLMNEGGLTDIGAIVGALSAIQVSALEGFRLGEHCEVAQAACSFMTSAKIGIEVQGVAGGEMGARTLCLAIMWAKLFTQDKNIRLNLDVGDTKAVVAKVNLVKECVVTHIN